MLLAMPLRGCGCWIPAVIRVVGLLLVGGAAAIFVKQAPHSHSGQGGQGPAASGYQVTAAKIRRPTIAGDQELQLPNWIHVRIMDPKSKLSFLRA